MEKLYICDSVPALEKHALFGKSLHSIIGCRAEQRERMHRFAGKWLFCQSHAFEFLTPTSSYRQLSFACFICRNFIPSKILSSNIISYNFIYNANGMFKLWELYCSHPFAGIKHSLHMRAIPYWNVLHDMQNFATIFNLVTIYSKEMKLCFVVIQKYYGNVV